MAATQKTETFSNAVLATAQTALQTRLDELSALELATPGSVGPMQTGLIFDGTNYIFTLNVWSDEPAP